MKEYEKLFKPKFVLVMYSDGHNDYVESHDVKDGQVLAGRPLKESTLYSFAERIGVKSRIAGVVPRNLVYFSPSPEIVVWRTSGRKRYMQFEKKLHIPNGITHIPKTIFILRNRQLSVFCYIKWQGINTQLYNAPYHNVSEEGDVCLGTVSKPKNSTIFNEIKKWEEAFWYSNFSEIHYSLPKTNMNLFWAKRMVSKDKFPERALVPIDKRKLKNYIKEDEALY